MNTRHGILNTLVLLGLLIFAPTFASGATYFVAPSGSNSNPGTLAAPFLTLQRAHDAAVAGDTIFMRGGTYNLNVMGQTAFSKSGTSGNTIKIFNYPGELPILDGSSVTNQFLTPLRMVNVSWWHIKGLEIKNAPYISISITGNSANITVENCIIHHGGRLATVGTGLKYDGTGGNNVFLNNDFHHNSDTIGGGNADGISVTSPGTSGNVLRGNRAWRNGDDGFDVWNSTGVLIENNWAWENGFNDAMQPQGDGNGFKLGGAGAGDGNHTVRNNLAWKNKARGLDQNGADIGITLHNNTGWSNPWGNYQFSSNTNVFTNNISFEPGSTDTRNGISTTNNWQVGTTSSADFVTLAWTENMGARQADNSLPASTFLHLAAGSDLIDKGVNVGSAYSGSAPDLGAFEYGGSTDTTPPTVSITAPTAGSTVSGTAVTVSAGASDNVGVPSVDFKVDGTTFFTDTASPYSMIWNTTSATNASHTLTATARDAAGNTTTSSAVSVTVSNGTPPPPPSSCTPTPLSTSGAFSDGGYAWMVLGTFGTPADNSSNSTGSTLRFFENGVEMGPAHALHVDIRNLGAGRFSHWSQTDGTGEALRLSASNNSDPRTNGKSYTYCATIVSPLLPPSRLRLDIP